MLFDASPSNRVVASRLERKLAESSDQPLLFKDSIPEYGGCRYLLQCDAASPDSLLLSIGFSQDTAREIDVTHDEAVEALQQHIGPCASVQNTPLPGYHFSVTVDVPQLRTCTRDQQTRWIERLASIRLALQGAPLRCGCVPAALTQVRTTRGAGMTPTTGPCWCGGWRMATTGHRTPCCRYTPLQMAHGTVARHQTV